MDRGAFTLCAEAFAVVGLSDVVVRSIVSLVTFASRVNSASATVRGLLIVLRGLGSAIAEVRVWATTHDQSVFATADGQHVSASLQRVLHDCQEEVLKIAQTLASLQVASSGVVAKWVSGARFARKEGDVLQSIGLLSQYTSSLTLLITSRIGTDTTIIRREQAVAAQVLRGIQSGVATQNQRLADLRQTLDDQATGVHSQLSEIQRRQAEAAVTELAVAQRVDAAVANINHGITTLTDRIASLTLTDLDDCHVLAEGDNLESAIGPLQVLNKGVAAIFAKLAPEGSLVITRSNHDWFASEMHKMLRFTYRSASMAAGPGEAVVGNVNDRLDFNLIRQISTIPLRASECWANENGWMAVEYVEGVDAHGRSVRCFRFACFTTGFTSSAVVGLVTRVDDERNEQAWPSRISRQLRVFNVRPGSDDVFSCAIRNDVDGLRQLFSSGQASVLDMTEHGFSLLGVAALFGNQDATIFLLRAGADGHMCVVHSSGRISTVQTIIWISAVHGPQATMSLSAAVMSEGVPLDGLTMRTALLRISLWSMPGAISVFKAIWKHHFTREAFIAEMDRKQRPGDYFMAAELILQGVLRRNPSLADELGSTALHIACSPRLDAADRLWDLLRDAAQAEVSHTYDWKSAYRAGFLKYIEGEYKVPFDKDTRVATIRLILRQGVDVNALDSQGRTPLFVALTDSDILDRLGDFSSLLAAYGASAAIVTLDGRPLSLRLLHEALDYEYRRCALEILWHQWDVSRNRPCEKHSWGPPGSVLHAQLKTMLEGGADPTLADTRGRTALSVARDLRAEHVVTMFERHASRNRQKHDEAGLLGDFNWAFGS